MTNCKCDVNTNFRFWQNRFYHRNLYHHPPLIGGINATVSPLFSVMTCPLATYSSFKASVRLSSSRTIEASFGNSSASFFRKKAVFAPSSNSRSVEERFPAASLAEAKNNTFIVTKPDMRAVIFRGINYTILQTSSSVCR